MSDLEEKGFFKSTSNKSLLKATSLLLELEAEAEAVKAFRNAGIAP
jgi:hypothetical protein